MRRQKLIEAAVMAGVIALWGGVAHADGGGSNTEEFSARLSGFQELGALNSQTGAILSDGSGTVTLDLDQKAGTVAYTLTYSDVGTTPPLTGTVTQAHIHFGKARDSGGVMVFFCTNLGNAPMGTPPCPIHGGTVTGTWTKASVMAIAGQNVAAGNFAALVDALNSNTAYANVHQTALTAGEIRGQVRKSEKDHH